MVAMVPQWWKFGIVLTGVLLGGAGVSPAEDLKSVLSAPLLAPGQSLKEIQEHTFQRIPALPPVTTREAWEETAARIRSTVFERALRRGAAAGWHHAPLQVEWLDELPGGPGYTIRRLRYQAVPGLWIPALLYRPTQITGKAPVFLNVNGHDPIGKAVDYKQLRCINQAKRGIIALNPEWFGMGQLRTEGYVHGRMNQLDLCGTSGLAPFYLALERGLDVLLSLPEADPQRVGVAGLSGGGWQTIVLSALDPRVTLSNPVAGYSSFFTRGKNFGDLGDSEQTPVDLATVADYSHLTALMAPRATLLTYNLNDNCCFKADQALPPLLAAARPVFGLYSRQDHLRYHINAEPGDHNFQKDNREALYQMIGTHFFPDQADYNPREIPSEAELQPPGQLAVPIPENNATFQSLARDLAAGLPREGGLPANLPQALEWQRERRAILARLVKSVGVKPEARLLDQTLLAGVDVQSFAVTPMPGWTLPVVVLTPEKPLGTTLLLGDRGRAGVAAEAERLVNSGVQVCVADLLFTGECSQGSRDYLFGLLFSAVGERPLGLAASQVTGLVQWLQRLSGRDRIRIWAEGPRVSLSALTAAALCPDAVDTLQLNQSLISLKEVIERNLRVEDGVELFCFGLLEEFDIAQLAALVAPRTVEFEPLTAPQAELLLPLVKFRGLWPR
jgi:dienelactone hydrolase